MATSAKKIILFIDDEPYMQTIVKTCLETMGGWHVFLANSGAEGIIKAEQLKPDAIILDVIMPGMDGIACQQQLKLNIKTQSIPIIFLTANAIFFENHQFLTLDVAGVIAKPFDPLQLVPQIANILDWDLEDSKTKNLHYISEIST